MLQHPGSEPYEEAAKTATHWATTKLNALIAHGRATTQDVLERVDAQIIDDAIVPYNQLKFMATETSVALCKPWRAAIHEHAIGQIVAKLGGSQRITDWALTPETADEFVSILNLKMQYMTGRKFLLRSVKEEVRGFLSDRYRRLDVRPLVNALVVAAVQEHGAVVTDAHMSATSFFIKLVLPKLFEPAPNEIGLFGLTFRNSDFGAGRLYIKGFFNRLWCTNLCM